MLGTTILIWFVAGFCGAIVGEIVYRFLIKEK